MAGENKSPVNTNGTILGNSDTEPLAFHGVSPIARAQVTTISANLAGNLTGTTDGTIADVANISITALDVAHPTVTEIQTAMATVVTSINLQNKETQTKLNEAITKLNALITALQNKGVIKA